MEMPLLCRGCGRPAFPTEGPFQTGCGCRGFRTSRSKAVTELCNLNVGYMPMISTIAAPPPGQKRPYRLDAIKLASATHTADANLRDCLSRSLQISV
mgnify:CR=1 FL=1